jgi:putative methyltransferase (TIGR04325 family)
MKISATRAAVRSLCPPILWELGHTIKTRLHPPPPPPVRYPLFKGPLSSWTEAVAQSDGWDSAAITAKTFEAALKVQNGEAEYEQDTHVLRNICYSPTILAFLALALSRNRQRLDVVDFGGGLATNYFQNRKILRQLADRPVTWTIVERAAFVELGRRHFARPGLRFVADLEGAVADLAHAPEAILFSGSLQYVAEPMSVLDKAVALGARTLAFDRLLVSPDGAHAIFVQCPDPQLYYPATYPVWCFSKPLFVDHLLRKGFTLVEDFTQQPDARFDHCGLVFVAGPERRMGVGS